MFILLIFNDFDFFDLDIIFYIYVLNVFFNILLYNNFFY